MEELPHPLLFFLSVFRGIFNIIKTDTMKGFKLLSGVGLI